MAVVDLGKLRFDWKGDFDVAIAYEERDVVRYQGDIYFFTTNHLGPWNPSDADVMLTGIDVIESQGDLITGDASGNNTRLAVDYNFANDSGSTRAGKKLLASSSTVPLPASVTKYLTVNTGGLYLGAAATTSTTYVVTVAQDAGTNKFHLDGTVAPALALVRGNTYVFDMSDATNAGHPLVFKVDGGSAYTNGVTTSGTAGTANATVTFVVPQSAPDDLRYYCSVHGDPMGNSATVTGGTSILTEYEPFEQDTITFNTEDTSLSGHKVRFSEIPNGVHGGQANTHVSYMQDGAGNKYLSVTSNVVGSTNGGTAVTKQRAIYSYVNDSGFSPTFTGTTYPYVLVTGTVTADSDITATISQNTLTDGTEILLINGRPAYQHTSDTIDTIAGMGGTWVAFDETGATTSTAFTTISAYGHAYATGMTYTGTEGTTGANISWAVPAASPTVYLYDAVETNEFTSLEVDPQAHPQTASLSYVTNGARLLQHVHVRERDLVYTNSGARLTSNVWYDLNQYYPNGVGPWTNGDRLRPQLTSLAGGGEASGFMHHINIHVGWDSGSYHQGGRVMRRYSSDDGTTWSAWESAIEDRNTYTGGVSRKDVDFGAYVYTSNAATYSYQGEQVQFSFLDKAVVAGRLYEYKLQFKCLNSTALIYLNWHPQYNAQTYCRTGNSEWNVQEVLL